MSALDHWCYILYRNKSTDLSSTSSSSPMASSIASFIISSFISMISDCFSNSIMIFWISGSFIWEWTPVKCWQFEQYTVPLIYIAKIIAAQTSNVVAYSCNDIYSIKNLSSTMCLDICKRFMWTFVIFLHITFQWWTCWMNEVYFQVDNTSSCYISYQKILLTLWCIYMHV